MTTTSEKTLAPSTRLLLEIADRIEEHPGNWDQSCWYDSDGQFDMDRIYNPIELREVMSESARNGNVDCGTTFCVAGWANVLASDDEFRSAVRALVYAGAAKWEQLKFADVAGELMDLSTDMKWELFMTMEPQVFNFPATLRKLASFSPPVRKIAHPTHAWVFNEDVGEDVRQAQFDEINQNTRARGLDELW